MTDALTITKTAGRVTIFHLSGYLDAGTESQLVEAARKEKETGGRFLLIDLGGIEMLSSAGLRALHNIFKLFTPREEIDTWQKENPGDMYKSPYFKLAGASSRVFSILNLAGFLHNIPIYPNVKGALESFDA